jgi:cytochrome P450
VDALRARDAEAAAGVDFTSEAFFADPYRAYARLREAAPVLWSDAWHGWLVTRYDDVKRVLEQPALFSSEDRVRPRLQHLPDEVWDAMSDVYGGFTGFFWSDPPAYSAHRAEWTHLFRPRIAGLGPRIQALVDELLDEVEPQGRMDVVRDVAHRLPAIVILELLGVPVEDRARFRGWTERMIQLANVTTMESVQTGMAGMDEACRWVRELLLERRREPRDDLMSGLAATRELEAMDDRELRATVVNLIQFLLAGHETTTSLIGSGLYALLRHPEELALLRAEPALTASAVEELLRYESPLQYLTRRATQDVELGGRQVRRDELVLPVLGAANRDPAQFADPDRLDVRRRPNRHLAFGFNVHFCLGAPLGRQEAQLALETVVRRLDGLRLAGAPPRWRHNAMFRGLESLEVAF